MTGVSKLAALFAAAAALGVSGCAGSYPHLSFAVEQRLLRETTLDDLPSGQAAEGDAVVRIIRTGHSAGSCSGALIGPRQVLTAQHCVMELDRHHELSDVVMLPGDMHVELGSDYLPWGRVGVRGVQVCEGYYDDIAHDVAVLLLSKDVTEIAPLAISWSEPTYEDAGMFDLTGFGTNEKLRAVPGTNWPVFQANRHVRSGALYATSAEKGFSLFRIPGAPGDSGGPIVDLATGAIVSVASRGRTDGEEDETKNDPGGPFVGGPHLATCKKAIETALASPPL